MDSIYTITGNNHWWDDRVGYQIYPRTFCDSNNDGVGDINGIISKLDYLVDLGIGAIWISPFYPSPGIDCGYDVSNFCDIDPEIGTLKEFDELLAQCHKRDIAVLLDIVPNHSSDKHELFQKALSDPNSDERDMYIFKDPAPNGGPPNNWLGVFGGSAWKYDEKSGQYFLHLFYEEQPDFNWRNEKVHAMFEDILRFWFDKGVDGFRVDVTQGLYKHPEFLDAEVLYEVTDDMGGEAQFRSRDSSNYYCLPETAKLFERWREISDEYGAILIGEMIETSQDRLERYFSGKGINMVFFLTSTILGWQPEELVQMFDKCRNKFPSQIAWMSSSHDNSRVVSRFGGGKLGRSRALAISSFMSLYDGFPFLYNGEELGHEDCFVELENTRDPRATRFANSQNEGRDKCRTNMTWDSQAKNQGFSESDTPWLISTPRAKEDCADIQENDENSSLSKYRQVFQLKKLYPNISISDLSTQWVMKESCIGYFSHDYFVGFNPGNVQTEIEAEGEWECIFSSIFDDVIVGKVGGISIPAESTCIYRIPGK